MAEEQSGTTRGDPAGSTGGFSLYEEEIYGEDRAEESTRQLLVFALADEWYAVDIMDVNAILPVPLLTLLPNVPSHIIGIFNYHGNIMSAVCLKQLFRLPDSEDTGKKRMVMIEHDNMATGLLVDGNEETIEVPRSRVQGPSTTLETDTGAMIEGQLDYGGRLIAVLSAQKVIEKTRL